MYDVIYTKKYSQSLKRCCQFKKTRTVLDTVITTLSNGNELTANHQNHWLKNRVEQECHIGGDLLLVYEIDKKANNLYLKEIGTHNQLFNKFGDNRAVSSRR